MKLFTRLALLAVVVVAGVSPAFAQATIHGDLTKDWAGQKALLVGLANAMPEDKYGFKPTPAQRSFGEHVLHIAQINVMLIKALGGKTPEPAIDMKATTKAATIKARGRNAPARVRSDRLRSVARRPHQARAEPAQATAQAARDSASGGSRHQLARILQPTTGST